MQKRHLAFRLALILVCCCTIEINAQSLSTGFPSIEDFYRREQLLGNIDQNFSFVSYPLFPVEAFNVDNPFFPENELSNSAAKNNFKGFNSEKEKFIFKFLPVLWKQQFNSHHPEGINDGAMIPSRGYQTLVSTGFFLKYRYLSIKIQPEFVHAANLVYDGFPINREDTELADVLWYIYYVNFLNSIDLPERFGESAYNKVFLGQSSIRLTFKSISLGLSTENLWWGPGITNSLIMTNSAPGFAHLTLNTVEPIKSIIGSFEGQIIAGYLKSSGYFPPEHERKFNDGDPFFIPKADDDRYINGIILSYQPKWIPGLFIGLIRSFQLYRNDINKAIDYLPIFSSFRENEASGDTDFEQKLDPYSSVFFRYVWPESNIEIYGEYGRSDYYRDLRDLVIQLEHSNAYNLGFRKLIPLNNLKKEYFQVHCELTQLAKNPSTILREGESWGISSTVRDGYTNNGQLLGAGIGPGSNLQTLKISWLRSQKMIGLQFERFVHNNDFFFTVIKDVRAHWVDISTSLTANWDYKNLLFMLELKAVDSKNYQWEFEKTELAEDYWPARGVEVYNFHGQFSVVYRF